MLASSQSPSPTYSAASSPKHPFHSRPYNVSHSPRLSNRSSQQQPVSSNRSTGISASTASHFSQTVSVSSQTSPSLRRMVDAATQYSPQRTGSPVDKERIEHQNQAVAEAIFKKEIECQSQAASAATAPELQQTPGKRKAESNSPSLPNIPNPAKTDAVAIAPPSSQDVVQQPVTPSNPPRPATPKRSRSDGLPKKPMPVQYETCDARDLGIVIADMLTEMIQINDAIPLQERSLTRFHSRAPPGISVQDYLTRLIVHATLSPPILLSMVVYIDRLCSYFPCFSVSSLTVHRFLITAATVASKGLSDSFWTNSTYARVGGVSVRELGMLELEFLGRVQWKIVPQPEVLVNYYRNLVDRNERYYIDEETMVDDDGDSASL